MTVLGWITSNKLTTFFIVATASLFIATIALAVEKNNLQEELNYCNERTTTAAMLTSPPPKTATSPEAESTFVTTLQPPDMSKYRLPTNVKPISYDLTFYPDLKTGNFSGKVTALVDVTEATPQISVHNNGLKFSNVSINGVEANFQNDADYELTAITNKNGDPIAIGQQSITIEYDGYMKNRIVGLYWSSYTTPNGTVREIATSKFEPTYARQAYPCFDEPNMKANYTVHLLKPQDDTYIALSNMPQIGEDVTPDGVLVHFSPSVRMSTYLSCFIVCDFNYTESTINTSVGENFPFRVYASPAQLGKTTFANDVGKGVIEYYLNYFNIPYPLPKLDLIAIPDFVSGAMEHWGLVTFRETALLYDPATSSTTNKQRVASVVAHELAHSWFGNLVTMNWWDDLWLNEGFAAYIEYKGVNSVQSDWQMLDQFIIETLHPVLALDATLGSQPIIRSVLTPDQITEIFDSITYDKGSSVLRMLEDAVGNTNFQHGITNYLNAHKFQNAVTQDLWDELQKIVGDSLNVTEFMKTWTVQMGYPIVNLTFDGTNYVLTQKQFLIDPDNPQQPPTSPYGYKWTIPVTYITNENSTPTTYWFLHTDESIVIPKPATAQWIKFNYNQVGFYRVNYDVAHWDTLSTNIGTMTVADKTHLLEESFSIAQAGQLDYSVPLNLTKYLKAESEFIPWSVASSKLQELQVYLTDSLYYSNFRNYVLDIVTPAYNLLTWNEGDADAHVKSLGRVAILNLACSMGHTECLNEASVRFTTWLNDTTNTVLSQDLRSLVYTYGMQSAGQPEWDKLWAIFISETDANEKLKLLKGLANVKEPWLLSRLIELAKDDTYIRSQDYFTCLQYIAANPIGTSIVWDYVRNNWPALVDRFTLNDRYLGRLIPSITKTFLTNIKLQEMQAFFAAYPEAGAGAAARVQALEKIANNIKWLENNKAKVEAWVQSYA